ncbi:MAG: IS3 family transposase [Nitrospira sp.]|nr:IS3 family transposase [Nitrospira sp.]
MAQKRRTHGEEFNARVAVEAIKGIRTLSELRAAHGVHPTVIAHWKRPLVKGAPEVFRRGLGGGRSEETVTAPLYQEGQLKMELEWLKKSSERVAGGPTRMASSRLHVVVDCAAVCLGGAGAVDVLVRAGVRERSEPGVAALIDRLYVQRPFYGVPRMTAWLPTLGHAVNHKRGERLMRVMGGRAVLPGSHTSRPQPEHRRSPYLLRTLAGVRANQVWCAAITYVPLRRGFLYLVAIMDWFSRYVVAWELGNTLDTGFCVEALRRALARGCPESCSTDQGAQFTSQKGLACVEGAGVRVSMDGRGRALDNVFVERLWRSVTYEEIYLREYADGAEAWRGLQRYVAFYNVERRHQSLGRRTPAEVHFG